MVTQMDYRRLSKTLAVALRHQPDKFGIQLDAMGWANVAGLLAGLRQRREWAQVAEADLAAVIAMPGKKRYEMENGRIRAIYGHSVADKIEKTPSPPPDVLYHGTAPETAELILREGLKPMSRQYVHLSVDVETAVQVGRRKSRHPTILKVLASVAHQNGILFYLGHDLVWLADFVPAQHITIWKEV